MLVKYRHLYVYDCVIHWDVHVGNSGSRCCTHNFGTAGCRKNGLSEHCHGTLATATGKQRGTKRGHSEDREHLKSKRRASSIKLANRMDELTSTVQKLQARLAE